MSEENNKFYVYVHRRKDNNEVFYVGKGTRSRAIRSSGRSDWWKRIVEKYGYVVEYVEKGLSQDDAFDLEIELIKFYKDNGHILCNLTAGGEGCRGTTRSQKHIDRMKVYHSSDEHKEMMKRVHGKRVLCSNGMVFDTCTEANAWLGLEPRSGQVSRCCRRKTRFAGVYVWRFLDDSEDLRSALDAGKDAYVEWILRPKLEKQQRSKTSKNKLDTIFLLTDTETLLQHITEVSDEYSYNQRSL